jgi:acyl carrier protein
MLEKKEVRDQKITSLIMECVEFINERLDNKVDLSKGEATALFGADGALDSLALVSLVVMVEQALEAEFGVAPVLVSEKAMSKRHSPFSTVGSLSAYAATLIQEEELV